MPKEIIVPKGVLKDEHISHIEEILNIYITFKEDTYINDLVDEESDNNKVKEENIKKDGIDDEKIEEFEKALTEKIVTRYNIIENKYMVLDSIARKNLELTQRMKDRK